MKSYSAQANEWKMKRYALLLYVILTFIPISLMDHLSHISQKKFECRPQEWSVQKFASRNSHHEISSKVGLTTIALRYDMAILNVWKYQFLVKIGSLSRSRHFHELQNAKFSCQPLAWRWQCVTALCWQLWRGGLRKPSRYIVVNGNCLEGSIPCKKSVLCHDLAIFTNCKMPNFHVNRWLDVGNV